MFDIFRKVFIDASALGGLIMYTQLCFMLECVVVLLVPLPEINVNQKIY